MRALLALLLALAMPALAQNRPFNCIGADQLEDDVFSLPFEPGRSTIPPAARSLLDAALERALAEPARPICVLGHAGAEGGAHTTVELAAARAGAVSRALIARGIPERRIRAEARRASFSPRARAGVPMTRSVSIVVLPLAP